MFITKEETLIISDKKINLKSSHLQGIKKLSWLSVGVLARHCLLEKMAKMIAINMSVCIVIENIIFFVTKNISLFPEEL